MPTTLLATAPPPNPANSPLGHYLLHPGNVNAAVLHHVLRVLEALAAIVVPIAIGIGALLVVLALVRFVVRHRRPVALAKRVIISPGPEVDAAGAEAFWNALHGVLRRGQRAAFLSGRPHVAFECTRAKGRLAFSIWVPPEVSAERVALAVEASWPGTLTEIASAETPPFFRDAVTGGELRLAEPEWYSLRTDHATDPYRHLLATLGAIDPDRFAVVQVLARPASPHRLRRARTAAVSLRSGRSMSRLVRFVDFWRANSSHSTPSLTADPRRSMDVRAIGEKAASLCFEGVLRYGVGSLDTNRGASRRLRSDAQSIVAAFARYDERNCLKRRRLWRPEVALTERRLGGGDLLSVAELASLAHLPTDLSVPGLSRAATHVVAPPPEVHLAGKVLADQLLTDKVLGHAETGNHAKVALSVADARQHVHILGATGSGKSTLITNLVLQDVAAGRGAVVLDPKGDLVNDILGRLPDGLSGKVVLLDPDDDTGGRGGAGEIAPPAMNVLDGPDPHLAVDHLVGIFHRLFSAYWGPRTDDVLRVAALSALALPGAMLADIPRILTDPTHRRACLRHVADPSLLGFWDHYDKLSPGAQAQMVGPVMNKLRVVLTRPFVAAVLGAAKSSFDLGSDVLDGGLLLARLPKGSLGEDCSALLGSFIVAKVWQEVTARARSGESARVDATLYVDECQNFLNLPGSLADMLAEARGYRLSVVAAHQYLGQLPSDLREALAANARNKIIFNCSPDDARVLERHIAPELSAYDLHRLGAYQAAVRLIVDAEEVPAFTMRTEPAGRADPQRRALVRKDAREHFGRHRFERHDELVRRNLTGRKGSDSLDGSGSDGTVKPNDRSDSSFGRSYGISYGTSLGIPHLPGHISADPHDDGSITPAGEDPDSWSDL